MAVHFDPACGHIDVDSIIAISIPKKGYTSSSDLEMKIWIKHAPIIEVKNSEEIMLKFHENLVKEWLTSRQK